MRSVLARWPWVLLGLALAILIVWPLAMLLVGAFRTSSPGLPGSWSVDGFVTAYTSPGTYVALMNSILLAVITTVVGLSCALLLLLISTKTTLFVARLITPAMMLLLALPSLFYAVSFAMLGNPRASLVNILVTGGSGSLDFLNATSWGGMVIVSTFKATAWAYIMLIGPFRAMSGSLEEAGRVMGASPWRAFFTIVVPMLRPALIGVSILLFVVGVQAFDVPLILGLPAGVRVFATEIYAMIGNNVPPDYAAACALALMLVAIVIALVAAGRSFLGTRSFVTVDAKTRNPKRWRFGRTSNVLLVSFASVFLLVAVLLPLLQIAIGSLQNYFGVYGVMSLRNYVKVFQDPRIASSLQTTAFIALVAGFLAMVAATVVSYVTTRWDTVPARLVRIASWLPLGLPGIVLALGLLWAYTSVPAVHFVYGTPWIMVIGLIVVGLPIGARSTDGAIAQISVDLESAARISGASRLRAAITVVARLISPTFLAGWFVVAIILSGNLDVPILLASSSTQPATLAAYQMYLSGDSSTAAALLCVVLMGGGIALGLVTLASRLVAPLLHRDQGKRRVPGT